jgi:hypothetical protein
MTSTATTEAVLPCCAEVAARRDATAMDAHRGLHLYVEMRNRARA